MKTPQIRNTVAEIHSTRQLLQVILLILWAMNPFAPNCHASAAGKEFNEADAALNSTYNEVLSTINEPKQRSLFVAAQKAWTKDRDANVAFFFQRYPESKGGLFYNVHLIRERTVFLKSLFATPPSADPEGVQPSGYL